MSPRCGLAGGVDVAVHTLEICSGVGMLGEGLRAGLRYLGIETRTVCHIEREAYAAAVLAARIEEGSLDPAPVWSDLLTFDARPWRGVVDGIVAGFPCQDISLAGRRDGLDGQRSGLFFDILDIADACGAWFLALENVAGISSATATVVDEAEGELYERAAARVVGELADRGWNTEWLTVRASDVGASHQRERWFAFAWRVGHAGLQHQHVQQRADGSEHQGAGQPLDNSTGPRCDGTRQRPKADSEGRECLLGSGRSNMGHTERTRRPQTWRGHDEHAGREPEPGCGSVADTPEHGRNKGRPEPGGEQGRPDAAECGGAMAHPSSPRLPQRISGGGLRDGSLEPDARPDLELHGRPLFAPGPADPRWPAILGRWPGLAPAIEAPQSRIRGVADGLAGGAHDCRTQRLRCIGNGVVPLQASIGFVQLLRRAGVTQP